VRGSLSHHLDWRKRRELQSYFAKRNVDPFTKGALTAKPMRSVSGCMVRRTRHSLLVTPGFVNGDNDFAILAPTEHKRATVFEYGGGLSNYFDWRECRNYKIAYFASGTVDQSRRER